LTGERHASKGLIKGQLDSLKDKKMAELGFEEEIGFIPYAGIGCEIFKTVTKVDSSPVRAAAGRLWTMTRSLCATLPRHASRT
jgi:hypothetical protein